MITGVRHTGFNCRSNLRALDRFYHDILGFELVWNKVENAKFMGHLYNAHHRIVTRKYRAPDGAILEFGLRPPQGQNVDLTHIGLVTDNIEEDYKILEEHGWYFTGKPIISPDGYGKVAVCFDPNGIAIELVEIIKDWTKDIP